jgi:hypothetical protein
MESMNMERLRATAITTAGARAIMRSLAGNQCVGCGARLDTSLYCVSCRLLHCTYCSDWIAHSEGRDTFLNRACRHVLALAEVPSGPPSLDALIAAHWSLASLPIPRWSILRQRHLVRVIEDDEHMQSLGAVGDVLRFLASSDRCDPATYTGLLLYLLQPPVTAQYVRAARSVVLAAPNARRAVSGAEALDELVMESVGRWLAVMAPEDYGYLGRHGTHPVRFDLQRPEDPRAV